MRAQIRGLKQASTNALDGISLIQTAEGALQETHQMLQRMRQLVVQASNDTLTAEDRGLIALEVTELVAEINATAEKTEFNEKKLINGDQATNNIHLQVGPNANTGGGTAHSILFTIGNMDAGAANLNVERVATGFAAQSGADMQARIAWVDSAITTVAKQRAILGATQNRLEHTIKNLDVAHENLTASESRIRDTDMAMEMMILTKNNVLAQAATSMLAQGNMAPQSILQLLR
jgi:flagellin